MQSDAGYDKNHCIIIVIIISYVMLLAMGKSLNCYNNLDEVFYYIVLKSTSGCYIQLQPFLLLYAI